MKNLEDKYIKLLLERCMSFEKSKYLFVSYDVAQKDFIERLKKYAEEKLGLTVYLQENDIYKKHDILKNIKLEDIKKEEYFTSKDWDEYAKKDAAFLMIASEFPKVMDDIDADIIAEASKVRMDTKKVYRQKQMDNELVWLIAVFPNKVWAKEKFPLLSEDEAYEKLFNLMMDVTMVKEKDPIASWDKQLQKQKKMMQKLNDLEIKSLHYTNSLGTDLTIGLNENAVWQSAGENDFKIIVNMPSYEVFTSPDYRLTEGIVYASKPLVYNSSLIEDFWVKFSKGKVVDYDAKTGKDILKGLIEAEDGMHYLGECALVDKNSPIAKTNFVFGETCLDENASCHIALGAGFKECIKDSTDMNQEELKKYGLNNAQNHIDFMIGTDDLKIEAETKEGTIEIFKDGTFNI